MKSVSHDAMAAVVAKQLPKGIFLSAGKRPGNTMTIGWGAIGTFWGQPAFVAAVRHSRYTHGLIKDSGVYTLSIPAPGELKDQLNFCGSNSGRDIDKFMACNLTPAAAAVVAAPIISQCPWHIECEVMHEMDMSSEQLQQQIARYYSDFDMHTILFGKIVACYNSFDK